jgi:hypothetical protein
MGKGVKTTAAVLAAVVFFIVITMPPRPRQTSGVDPGLAERTVAGGYHIHTTESDGAGDRSAVAGAAARAGLKFVIITDHGDGTRRPAPPAYIDGVLCVEGVEVSTTGGHYVALALGPAPYPLGGESSAVIEDVSRLGGFGFAAHPDSARPELSWTDWTAPFDGVEWLNADSEWRNETRARLVRLLSDYLVRPGPALASILDRPVETLARWDALTATRRVASIAGHDAHGGIGRSVEYRGTRQASWAPAIPSYEASFRSFSTRVVLEHALTGDASSDAAALLGAIRAGRMFTAVDALAAPAVLDFHATRGSVQAAMGESMPPGPVSFVVAASVPAGARTLLLRNGQEVAAAQGGALRMDTAAAFGAYRLEVHVPGAPGQPPVPWILSNPIYFLNEATPPPARTADEVPLGSEVGWHIEKDRGSTGSVVASPAEVAFYYRLRGPGRTSQFVAAVANLPGKWPAADGILLRATAARPARVSVQLRYASGVRWGRSVYLDSTPRDVLVPLREMRPADHQVGAPPPLPQAASLLVVVDLTNTSPGAANTIRLTRMRFLSGNPR